MVLTIIHSSLLARHLSFQKNYVCTEQSFFWEGMKKDIVTFVEKCDTCQWDKGKRVKALSPLKPFPTPLTLRTYISIDFIAGLPKAGNKLVIMVVVD